MKPAIDEDLCIGDALCEDLCPDVFELGDDGLAHIINDNPGDAYRGCVRDAEAACPTSAITIEE